MRCLFKNKKRNVILLLISSSFIFFPLSEVQANPLPLPKRFGELLTGLFIGDHDLLNVNSNVSIDVYDQISIGRDSYLLRNLNDSAISYPIMFISGLNLTNHFKNETAQHVFVNGTQIDGQIIDFFDLLNEFFDNNKLEYFWSGYDFILHDLELEIYTLNFSSREDILLEVEWEFQSAIEEDYTEHMFDIIEDRNRFYYTGYLINGGQHWNNHSIEYESVSFNFYTQNFFVEENTINVAIQENPFNLSKKIDSIYPREEFDFIIGEANPISLSTDEEVVSYSLEFFDIQNDYQINIVNDLSSKGLSDPGKTYIGLVSFVGIIRIYYQYEKKKSQKKT